MGLQSSYLQDVAEDLVPLYTQLETDILTDIARRIAKYGKLTEASEWQMKKLYEMGALNKKAMQKAASLAGKTEDELLRIFDGVCTQALEADDLIYANAGLTLTPLSATPAFRQTMLSGLQKTKGLFNNFTMTTANSAGTIFSDVLDRAYMQVISGAFSPDEALRRAISALASQSISKLTYASGSVSSAGSAARRSLMTGLNQTTAQLQLMRADQMGCELVEVTAHLGARPSHAVWQGQVYCRTGKHSKYKNFYDATGYGTGEGLCGWNCYHSFFPYFEGLSGRTFSNRMPGNAQAYEDSQKQRAIERSIRASKRRVQVLDAAIQAATSPQLAESLRREFVQASVTLSARRTRLETFLVETGRMAEPSRIFVPGYSQSVSSKAVWAARKAMAVR